MVELVVALPILVLISVGVMDYGRVYFASVTVANAARAGAEWGSTTFYGYAFDNPGQAGFALKDGAEISLDSVRANTVCRCTDEATVTCSGTFCAGYGDPRVYVTVTAYKKVNLLIRYPGLPSSVQITRSTTFRAK